MIRHALASGRWDRVIAFSRDEVKQAQLRQEFGKDGPRLFLGDVRDAERLSMAMRGVDTVVHAAALKRVDAGSYSPSEMVATNVLGTMNVVSQAIHARVRQVVVVSSDKCVHATNIYGSSKFMAECFAVSANSFGYPTGTRIAAVRYGNVLGSRGSVVGIWRDQVARGVPLTITDTRMTRFVMTIETAVALVLHALDTMQGGEVFVPLLPSARIPDLAQAVAPLTPGVDCSLCHGKGSAVVALGRITCEKCRGTGTIASRGNYQTVDAGIRAGGEKLHESLLNEEEPARTRRHNGCYVVAPSLHEWTADPRWAGDLVDPGLVYRSDLADRFLSVAELREMLAGTEACR